MNPSCRILPKFFCSDQKSWPLTEPWANQSERWWGWSCSSFGGGLHRPVARHGHVARADERVAIGTRHVLEEIFGEEPPVDFDTEPVGEFGDLDTLSRLPPAGCFPRARIWKREPPGRIP